MCVGSSGELTTWVMKIVSSNTASYEQNAVNKKNVIDGSRTPSLLIKDHTHTHTISLSHTHTPNLSFTHRVANFTRAFNDSVMPDGQFLIYVENSR